MKLVSHEITLGGGVEVFIDTPAGFVRIVRSQGRKIVISTPESLTVSRGQERAAESAKYVRVDGDKVYPRYGILVPKVDESGELEDTTAPAVLSMKVGAKHG